MLRKTYHIFVYLSMLNVRYISEIKNFFRYFFKVFLHIDILPSMLYERKSKNLLVVLLMLRN